MRIVIDLQAYQCNGKYSINEGISLVKNLIKTSESNEIWVLLNHFFDASIVKVRQGLANVVPADHVRVFYFPGADKADNCLTQNYQNTAENLRICFLADLTPDIVFAPFLAEALNPFVVCSGSKSDSHYKTVYFLSDHAIPLLRSHEEGSDKMISTLTHGDQIICSSNSLLESVSGLMNISACHLNISQAKEIWKIFESLHAHMNFYVPVEKEKLAFVSPLPPKKSGVADYSAVLIPVLSQFFEITIIVDQQKIENEELEEFCNIKSSDWFFANGDTFDHVLYQFGNSPPHKHMFKMLEQFPGVVVLHDFFLANLLDYLDFSGYAPGSFGTSFYYSHGISGLMKRKEIGIASSIWAFPCNKRVIDLATGVIVHSNLPRQFASSWYGSHLSNDWRIIPLIRAKRKVPCAKKLVRKSLGFTDRDFIVCAFGVLGFTKCNLNLLDAWLHTRLHKDSRCFLIFVGENDNGDYGNELVKTISQQGSPSRIKITGYVTKETYTNYLSIANCAVQLRTENRGESSASLIDCLQYGVPTIANLHGTTREFPSDLFFSLEDQFEATQLIEAIQKIWIDKSLAAAMSARGEDYVAAAHSSEKIGELYYRAIKDFARARKHLHFKKLIESLVQQKLLPTEHEEKRKLAISISNNRHIPNAHQLFLDISALVQTDLKTGIQRVVRSIVNALLASTPPGYRIEPVYSLGQGRDYQYARQFMESWIEYPIPGNEDAPINIQPGDIFLGLDLYISGTRENRTVLERYRKKGAQIFFVIYDMLPVLRPEVFPEVTNPEFVGWLKTICHVSEGLICISKAVADELINWILTEESELETPPKIGFFHLGADIPASNPSFGLTHDSQLILDQIKRYPSALMVGTIEPRKGYAQALSALEILWNEGVEINLVIVGKHGWMVDELIIRLESHVELGNRLHWLPNASDEFLIELYSRSSVLLAASEGEGFGLPLIEAAKYNMPILARDLPVFREILGANAYYFEGFGSYDLANQLKTWLDLFRIGEAITTRNVSWLTWEKSALQLLEPVLRDQWYWRKNCLIS
jgi:glycosyltransferase involved in cell wall biosynthesis